MDNNAVDEEDAAEDAEERPKDEETKDEETRDEETRDADVEDEDVEDEDARNLPKSTNAVAECLAPCARRDTTATREATALWPLPRTQARPSADAHEEPTSLMSSEETDTTARS